MDKMKRVLAIGGIVLLLSLYLITFISAFMSTEYSQSLFLACIYATFVIPIMIYAYMLIYRVIKNKREDNFKNSSSFPDELKNKDK